MAFGKADWDVEREHALSMRRLPEGAAGHVGGPDGEALSDLFQMPPDGALRVPEPGRSTRVSSLRPVSRGEGGRKYRRADLVSRPTLPCLTAWMVCVRLRRVPNPLPTEGGCHGKSDLDGGYLSPGPDTL